MTTNHPKKGTDRWVFCSYGIWYCGSV